MLDAAVTDLARPQSMRIAPASGHSTTHSHLQNKNLGAPSAPGIHDTLRSGVGPKAATNATASIPDSAHPLEARLKQWEATQDALKMEGLRRTFGMSEPIRRGMELKITREGEWRPAALGGSGTGVHEDILSGRDTSCSWEDIFKGDEMRSVPGFHEEVEKKVRMQ
ncbi:Proteasome maturation factor UMP1 [Phlyctema vagabunda]|uniref:Proteasome maturation factor UMP1 n=1 Tax=Phlyctema vagabunda TaxID=108571 RepID=A0ABR4PW07_9HELO